VSADALLFAMHQKVTLSVKSITSSSCNDQLSVVAGWRILV
jgi:hypothetical protein